MNLKSATRAYQEAAISGASNVELVLMMYDMIIEDLDRTIKAAADKDIDTRTTETKHVLAVLEQLQGTLDMTNGGAAAVNMDHLYSVTRGKLLEASIKNSTALFRELREIFVELKAAWMQVGKVKREDAIHEEYVGSPILSESASDTAACDWSA